MKNKIAKVVMGVVVAGLVVVTAWAGQTVKLDKDNVTASRLEGKWIPDMTRAHIFKLGNEPVEFKVDSKVPEKLPKKYDKFLGKKQIFLAGVMKWGNKEYPFVLITHSGNPHLVVFRERDGDPMGDAESSIVMLARAKEQKNDILFIGGDFNNEAFRVYKRSSK